MYAINERKIVSKTEAQREQYQYLFLRPKINCLCCSRCFFFQVSTSARNFKHCIEKNSYVYHYQNQDCDACIG